MPGAPRRSHASCANIVGSSPRFSVTHGPTCGAAPSKPSRLRKRETRKRYVDEVLRAAMSVQFGKDNDVRFRQVDLTGISVESLFVDVPASSHPGSPADRLLKEINPPQKAGQATLNSARGCGASPTAPVVDGQHGYRRRSWARQDDAAAVSVPVPPGSVSWPRAYSPISAGSRSGYARRPYADKGRADRLRRVA